MTAVRPAFIIYIMLVSQTLSPVAVKNGGRIAFRYLKHAITYKDFWETANRYSYYLQKEIGHDLRVGLWMSNGPHIAYSFIALSNIKCCAVPLNPWATPEENLFKIKNSGMTVILCTSDHARNLKEFLSQNGLGGINVIDMEGKRCAEYDPSYTPPPGHAPAEKDEILLLYTPGTTGKYKGCLFNHTAVAYAMTAVKNASKTSLADVFYTQYHYSNAFNLLHFMLAPLAAGATIYISDQIDFAAVLSSVVEHRVTRMAPTVAHLPELLKFSETEKMPIVPVKFFYANGVSLSRDLIEQIKRQTRIGVINVYGMTEFLGTIAMGNPELTADPLKPGLIGPPIVGTKIRLVDDNNDEIDKKHPQKGQLLAMGPALMSKYHGLAEEQKMAVRGTWLFTGDFVEIDVNGNIVFMDRKSDIVTIGENRKVFAREIEPIVKRIPEVLEVAYVGIRDRLKKPVAALIVVRQPQAKFSEKQLMEYLMTKIPSDKLPASIFFVDSLSRTVSGAINRAKLRSQFDGM